jgi:hypothetical protein
MLEVLDGVIQCPPHFPYCKANVMRLEANNILSLKEEGDASHVNQACYKFVAKNDKQAKTKSLSDAVGCLK